MKTYRSHKKQVNKIVTRVAGTLCFFGALGCILMVAIGGAFPSSEHGTQIVVPRTGDVWEVGELHTVQWYVLLVRPFPRACAECSGM